MLERAEIFFRHFDVKKARLRCLLRGSLAYIYSGFLLKYAICEESLWKNCVFAPKYDTYIKGSENFLIFILTAKKIDSPREHYTSFPLVTRKMLLARKIEKAYLACNFFCLPERRNSRHFFKLGAWCAAKPRACLLRFSALKVSVA